LAICILSLEMKNLICYNMNKLMNEEDKMKYGLKEEVYNKILSIAKENKQYKFILFGSRARGNYKKESDIDIAIKGNIMTDDKYRIINEFDLINTIHKIDLVFIDEFTKKELVESINNEGVEIK